MENTLPINSVKYIGINIDEILNWKQQISDITITLNKANDILSKLRQFMDIKTLKSIYHNFIIIFIIIAVDYNIYIKFIQPTILTVSSKI